VDLTGHPPFGELAVVGPGRRPDTWRCRCSCGRVREYGAAYLRKVARHCGCLRPARVRQLAEQTRRQAAREQAGARRAALEARNRAIVAAHEAGTPVAELAERHGLSRERVYQFIRQAAAERLPPLTWCG